MKSFYTDVFIRGLNIEEDSFDNTKSDIHQAVIGVAIGTFIGGCVDYLLGHNGITGMEIGGAAGGSIGWINNRVRIGIERVLGTNI